MKIRQLNKAIPSSGLHCTALPSSRLPKLFHSVEVCGSEKQCKGVFCPCTWTGRDHLSTCPSRSICCQVNPARCAIALFSRHT